MRNKAFVILIDICIILCAVLCAAGAGVYIYLGEDAGGADRLALILLVQNAVFFIAGFTVLIFAAVSKKEEEPEPDQKLTVPYISRLMSMKDTGDIKSDYDLVNKKAIIIGKNDLEESGLEYAGMGDTLKHEYAVMNLEKNYWYIEAVSDVYGVGVRKEHDSVFRRLRTGKPCLMGKNDIIEIAGEKIIVR